MRMIPAFLVLCAAPALAVSLPVERDWAEGTNWRYHHNFHGFPAAWVYVPDTFTPRVEGRRGLVFHLAGCGQMPYQAAQASGWADAADSHGLVIVVPGPAAPAHPNRDAPNVECFNYGYDGAYGVRQPTRDDPDPAAIIAAARALGGDADLSIDPNQIYVAGLSAGGAMAVEVGCMAPDVFAGVVTSAAPGVGTAQGTAVMPPPAGYGADTMVQICQGYARGSGDADALGTQVHIVVSDDNGLPAGNGLFDTSKFNDQTIWDGDKFCPHVYSHVRTDAFVTILGLGAPAREAVIAEGEGIGCPGGENSRDDGGEVQCIINDQIRRRWQAHATIWEDAEGRTRLVKVEQDTLRHAWPSGPVEGRTVNATPTRETLRADGYIDEGTGEFDRGRMGQAPNGVYGTIYFNHDAFDLPMYAARLFSENNPRLGDAVAPEQPEPVEPEPEMPPSDFALEVGAASADAGCVRIAGTVTGAPEVRVHVLGFGAGTASLAGEDWTFERCALPPGGHNLVVAALADDGVVLRASELVPVRLAAEPVDDGGGGALEEVNSDLYDHVAEGRVLRFTEAWFDYRERFCVLEGFAYVCEPFSLYRCEGDAEWLEQRPDCGGGAAPEAEAEAEAEAALTLTAELDAQVVDAGTVSALDATLENGGPDAAPGAFVFVSLPVGTAASGPGCTLWRDRLACDVGTIELDAQASLALTIEAPAGVHALHLQAGSVASAPLGDSLSLEVVGEAPPEVPPETEQPPPETEQPPPAGNDPAPPDSADPGADSPPPGVAPERHAREAPELKTTRVGGCSSAPAGGPGWLALLLLLVRRRRRP